LEIIYSKKNKQTEGFQYPGSCWPYGSQLLQV